jgi:hypothetical protein
LDVALDIISTWIMESGSMYDLYTKFRNINREKGYHDTTSTKEIEADLEIIKDSENNLSESDSSKMKAADDTAGSQTDDKKGSAKEENKEGDSTVKMDSKEDSKEETTTSMDEDSEQTMAGTSDDAENLTTHSGSTKVANTDPTPVAAQIEVLYEMNQKIDVKPEVMEEAAEAIEGQEQVEKPPATSDEIQVWVGTFEGWLNGGPDGDLQWKVTKLRLPDSEFPGLYTGGYR